MSHKKAINFESLEWDDSYGSNQTVNYVSGFLLFAAILTAIISLAGFSESAINCGLVLIFITMIYLGYVSALKTNSEEKLFRAFITDNDFQTSSVKGVDHIATSLLADGHSFKISYAFKGVYDDQAFEARILSYTIGYTKDAKIHNFVCLQFSIAQILPFVQLAAWNFKEMADADMKPSLAGTNSLQLEGTFNERFNVAIVPGTQQRVLQFMTPDFMDEVINLPDRTNIEFAGPNFFAIAAFDYLTLNQSKESINIAFTAADACLKQMSDISRSWDANATKAELEQFAQISQQPRLQLFANAAEW